MNHFSYADDGQGYQVLELPIQWTETASQITACVGDIQKWMDRNMLKLNQDKFEYIVFHPRHRPVDPQDFVITIGDTTFMPSSCVKNLGVNQDECLTMEKHVSSIARSCYHQIRSIGRIREYISTDACRALIQSTVTSRLDYSNVLLHNLPKSLMHRLQLVQNTCARLVTRTRRRDHISPVLRELHWLPVEYRVKYKVLLYTYKALNGLAPQYISDLVQTYVPARSLRSASQSLLQVPKFRTATYGTRSFRVSAPQLWNQLPDHVKQAPSLLTFKKQLKTCLFRQAHSV